MLRKIFRATTFFVLHLWIACIYFVFSFAKRANCYNKEKMRLQQIIYHVIYCGVTKPTSRVTSVSDKPFSNSVIFK